MRRVDGGVRVHGKFGLFCSRQARKKNKAGLFFFRSVLAVSCSVCLPRQIRVLSLRLQELKTLFTSIQGIHKTREGVAAVTKVVNN